MKATPLLDLFAIEELWTEEQRIVRDSVRRFSRQEFGPGVAQWYLDEVVSQRTDPRSR